MRPRIDRASTSDVIAVSLFHWRRNGFGAFSDALIVGNFGDGQLHAYDPQSGKYLGEFKDENGKPVVIDGLWGITFGNGGSGGDRNALYFASGPDDETHGLFGSLRVQ